MKTQCENCSHKKAYEELVQQLNDMSRLVENSPFHITATCRFYSSKRS